MTEGPKKKEISSLKKIIIVAGILIIVVGILAIVAYKFYQENLSPQKKVIAKVGSKKIYQSELNDAIYSLNYNDENLDRFGDKADEVKKSLLDSLIEEKVLEIKAKEVGVSVSEDEILKEARNSLREFDNYDKRRQEITKRQAKAGLLKKRIAEKVVSWRSGKFILVRGDLHFQSAPTGISYQERENLIRDDLKYGEELINSIYGKIKKGEITFEEGMKIANEDLKLGIPAWQGWTMIFSQEFSKEDSMSRNYPTYTLDFWEKIGAVSIGEISQPSAVKVILGEDSPAGKKGQAVDGLYLIVKIEDGNNGEAVSYDEWILKMKKDLGVKIYPF